MIGVDILIGLASILCLCGAVVQTCVGESCTRAVVDEALHYEWTVFVFANGGNNSDSDPVLHETIRAGQQFEALAEQWAAQLALPVDGARVFSAQAVPLSGAVTSDIVNNNTLLFVVAAGEHWIWPGVYVGYRVHLPAAVDDAEIAPLVLTTLALSPRLFRIDSFVGDAEIRSLIGAAQQNVPSLSRATEEAETHTLSLHFEASHLLGRLRERIGRLTQVSNETLFEPMQLTLDRGVRRFEAQYDYFLPDQYPDESGAGWRLGEQRLATLLVYLSDGAAGGETVFPKAGVGRAVAPDDACDCLHGLKVPPQRGTALLWYNVLARGHMDGERDAAALHGTCPLARPTDELWSARVWLRNKRASDAELAAEVRRARAASVADAVVPTVAGDAVVDNDAPYPDPRFPLELTTDGYRFVTQHSHDHASCVQVLRTKRRALDVPTSEQFAVRVFRLGCSDHYVRMFVARSHSKHVVDELLHVVPAALRIAGPEEISWRHSRLILLDESGAALVSSVALNAEQTLFVAERGDQWIWPTFQTGHRAVALNGSVWLESLAVTPNLFRVDGLANDTDVALLVDAAEASSEKARSVGGGLFDRLPEVQIAGNAELDNRVCALLRVPLAHVGATWKAWRADNSSSLQQSLLAPANPNSGKRTASLLLFGGDDSLGTRLVFPFSNRPAGAGAGAQSMLDACSEHAGNSGNATVVAVARGSTVLLYHVSGASGAGIPAIDRRAAFVLCLQQRQQQTRWIFEKAVSLAEIRND